VRTDRWAPWVLCFGWLGTITGCSKSPSEAVPGDDGGPSLIVPPVTCPDAGTLGLVDAGACVSLKQRSFTREIVPLFNSCAGEVCHSFNAGQIAQQIGVPSVECCGALQMIEPGQPERSYVLRKLLGRNLCAGSQMPLDQPAFSADDIQTVSDWICQGADTSH
jgi:hypothetical protein